MILTSRSRGASPETILMAERDVASTAARNRGHETPGAAAGQMRPAAWSLRTGAGGNAGDGSGPWADNATVERREAASRLRGRAHASQAWRRALPARLIQGWRLSALRHPLGGWQQDEGSIPGAPQAPREGDEWLEGVVAGTSGTGLFDIVNRGSAHRAGCVLSAGATHRHALSPPLEQHTRLSSPRRRGPSIPAVRVYGTMGPRFRGDDSS